MQNFLFQTPTQWVVLALLFVAGWAFGYASAPGGRRWRERYNDERDANLRDRQTRAAELRDAQGRITQLEAENARLARVTPATVLPTAAVGTAAAVAPAKRGWFGWGRDNLSRIRGIDDFRETRLHQAGIKTYAEIEAMTPEVEATIERELGLSAGTIAREQWREQAALLRDGHEDEHAARFG